MQAVATGRSCTLPLEAISTPGPKSVEPTGLPRCGPPAARQPPKTPRPSITKLGWNSVPRTTPPSTFINRHHKNTPYTPPSRTPTRRHPCSACSAFTPHAALAHETLVQAQVLLQPSRASRCWRLGLPEIPSQSRLLPTLNSKNAQAFALSYWMPTLTHLYRSRRGGHKDVWAVRIHSRVDTTSCRLLNNRADSVHNLSHPQISAY
jgi:hypothetical protein